MNDIFNKYIKLIKKPKTLIVIGVIGLIFVLLSSLTTADEKEKGKTNLKVEALFGEPEEGVAQSQVTTYPYAVALAELETLPDSIELISKY